MTASDYIAQSTYAQRERETDLRNERRRRAMERQDMRHAARRTRDRRGLSYVVRHRLAELFTDAPARG